MTDNSPLRWHSNPCPRLRGSGDTVLQHQRRVAELCRDLAAFIRHPLHDSDLIEAALNHDAAEVFLGDMPAPAKARFPALAAAYADAEYDVLREMGFDWALTIREDHMLQLCDKLDAYVWARRHGASGPAWDASLARIRKLAHGIDPLAAEWLRIQLDPPASS